MNCESGEVNLSTLPPGACFELQLSRTTALRGVLVRHGAGSVEVNVGESRNEHWCADAPVVYFAGQEASKWLNRIREENNKMAKEKNVKQVKESKITVFEISAKEAKKLADKENDSQLAIVYRGVADNGPCEFDDVYQAIYRRFQGSKAKPEKIRINIGTYLHRLVKVGLVKRSKKVASVAATAA